MKTDIYLPVPFPLSQYFLTEDFSQYIHLINDDGGVKKWGLGAYFVPAWLFVRVMRENREDFAGYLLAIDLGPEQLEIIEFDDPRKSQTDPFDPECHISGMKWVFVPREVQNN